MKICLGEFSQKDVFFFFFSWKQNPNRYLLDLQGTDSEERRGRDPLAPLAVQDREEARRAGDALGREGGLQRPLFSGRWMLRGPSRGFPAL